MPNQLTGFFDVVVEVRVAAVNRILATLHQMGADKEASPKFLHSLAARVGDVPKHPTFELAEAFLQALGYESDAIEKIPETVLGNVQKKALEAQNSFQEIAQDLTVSGIEQAGQLEDLADQLPWITTVRGTAKTQVSTLKISVPDGSTSELTVHAQIRAHYTPDPNTFSFPDRIHGELQATFVVSYVPASSGAAAVLQAAVSEDKKKVLFVPDPATKVTESEARLISRQIWRFSRTKFEDMTVELPEDFPFRHFKGLGTGPTQAIALPFLITGHIPALSKPMDSVSALFLGSTDDFGVAISDNYLNSVLEDALQALEDFSKTFSVSVTIIPPPPALPIPIELEGSVHMSVADAELKWKAGKISLVVEGDVTIKSDVTGTDHYDVLITQDLTLTLNTTNQTVTLQAPSAPTILGLPDKLKEKALEKISDLKNNVLSAAGTKLQSQLNQMRAKLDDGLQTFDTAASSAFTALEVTADGLILHGTVSLSERPSVVVEVTESSDGSALSAFRSWVPAGTIDEFVWSWVSPPEADSAVQVPIWGGVEHEHSDAHSFIFRVGKSSGLGKDKPGAEAPPPPKPPPWHMYQMCLRVAGHQVGSTGTTELAVTGGSTCQVEQPDWLVATREPWVDEILMVPVWGPDPGPEGILERAIRAHVNAAAARPPKDARTNTIVHFVGDQSAAPLSVLSQALMASRQSDAAVAMILVLPRGSFAQTRSRLEQNLGAFPRDVSVPLAVTEDYGGSWTRAFGASTVPATYLMSATGELVWQDRGSLDPASLTSALDASLVAGRRPRSRLQRLAVQPGQRAPDYLVERRLPAAGGITADALRDQPVLLNFWKSASTASMSELRHLQDVVARESGSQSPFVVAIGDGEGPDDVARMEFGRRGRIALVPDPDRQVARQYGVNCWPTTIAIDRRGRIEGGRFGMSSRRHRSRPAGGSAKPDITRP